MRRQWGQKVWCDGRAEEEPGVRSVLVESRPGKRGKEIPAELGVGEF